MEWGETEYQIRESDFHDLGNPLKHKYIGISFQNFKKQRKNLIMNSPSSSVRNYLKINQLYIFFHDYKGKPSNVENKLKLSNKHILKESYR